MKALIKNKITNLYAIAMQTFTLNQTLLSKQLLKKLHYFFAPVKRLCFVLNKQIM